MLGQELARFTQDNQGNFTSIANDPNDLLILNLDERLGGKPGDSVHGLDGKWTDWTPATRKEVEHLGKLAKGNDFALRVWRGHQSHPEVAAVDTAARQKYSAEQARITAAQDREREARDAAELKARREDVISMHSEAMFRALVRYYGPAPAGHESGKRK